ncbi:hypothetical protein ACHAWF_013988 [Thalassiosira exigua]
MKSDARNYNHDLIMGINHLKEKRDEVVTQMEAETVVLNKLQGEIRTLNGRLAECQAKLKNLQESKDAYTNTIEETELVYEKIQESSQNLLHVIKRETKSIQKNLDQKNRPS